MTLCLCLCFLFLYILYFPSHLLAHIVCISLLFLVNSSFISSDSSRFALNQSLQTLLTCFILFLFYLFSPLTLSLFLSNFFLVSLCRLFFLFPSLNLYLCVFSPSLHFVFYPSLCLSVSLSLSPSHTHNYIWNIFSWKSLFIRELFIINSTHSSPRTFRGSPFQKCPSKSFLKVT